MDFQALQLACILVACGVPAYYYLSGGAVGPALLALLTGLAWASPGLLSWPRLRRLRAILAGAWLSNLCFALLTLLSSWATLADLGWGWSLLAVVAGLAAWDLRSFVARTTLRPPSGSVAGPAADRESLSDRQGLFHLAYLAGTLATSLILVFLTTWLLNAFHWTMRLDLALGLSLGLAVALILLLRLLLRS